MEINRRDLAKVMGVTATLAVLPRTLVAAPKPLPQHVISFGLVDHNSLNNETRLSIGEREVQIELDERQNNVRFITNDVTCEIIDNQTAIYRTTLGVDVEFGSVNTIWLQPQATLYGMPFIATYKTWIPFVKLKGSIKQFDFTLVISGQQDGSTKVIAL